MCQTYRAWKSSVNSGRGPVAPKCSKQEAGTSKRKEEKIPKRTRSDVVKGPLIALEERMAFDLLHSGAAQTNLPAHSGGA